MFLNQINIYPIKSCRGIQLKSAQVTPKGFPWDREFMWVDAQGKFITQRQYPLLATIEVKIDGETLTLSTDNSAITPFSFSPTLEGREITVEVWRDRTIAIDQGNEVSSWLQSALSLPQNTGIRLVRQSPQHIRAINPQYAKTDSAPVSFADGYPYLLTNTASLEDLNQRIIQHHQDSNQAIPMDRFRANLVVDTDKAFAEDNWETIQIGDVIFDVAKPCTRCIITTTNQFTGVRNSLKEPLRTLATFRQVANQGIMFGENLIPRNTGILNQGDEVVT